MSPPHYNRLGITLLEHIGSPPYDEIRHILITTYLSKEIVFDDDDLSEGSVLNAD